MAGPTSARGAAGLDLAGADSVVLLIVLEDAWIGGGMLQWGNRQVAFAPSSIHPRIQLSSSYFSFVAGRGAGETKTHDRCQPWVFVKVSRSTNASGIAGYDDYQKDRLGYA